jgi:hypothetical protein
MISIPVKYTFSGHESFHCREMWLKKGYDHLTAGRSFNDPDAVVSLGVGKNMVTSMKFWLRAFDLLDENDRPNAFADFLFRPVGGFDPFLEDDQSLWLLHYQLVKHGFSSIYKLIFNEFRKEKIQFTKEQFQAFALRKINNANLKTVADDFDVFKKMYLSKSEDSKVAEDSFLGLLADLQLLRLQQKGTYYIEQTERPTLSAKVLLYTILDNENYGYSVSLQALENDEDSPGTIFALSRQNLLDKIEELTAAYDWINYSDQAGVRELQFRQKPADLLSIFN